MPNKIYNSNELIKNIYVTDSNSNVSRVHYAYSVDNSNNITNIFNSVRTIHVKYDIYVYNASNELHTSYIDIYFKNYTDIETITYNNIVSDINEILSDSVYNTNFEISNIIYNPGTAQVEVYNNNGYQLVLDESTPDTVRFKINISPIENNITIYLYDNNLSTPSQTINATALQEISIPAIPQKATTNTTIYTPDCRRIYLNKSGNNFTNEYGTLIGNATTFSLPSNANTIYHIIPIYIETERLYSTDIILNTTTLYTISNKSYNDYLINNDDEYENCYNAIIEELGNMQLNKCDWNNSIKDYIHTYVSSIVLLKNQNTVNTLTISSNTNQNIINELITELQDIQCNGITSINIIQSTNNLTYKLNIYTSASSSYNTSDLLRNVIINSDDIASRAQLNKLIYNPTGYPQGYIDNASWYNSSIAAIYLYINTSPYNINPYPFSSFANLLYLIASNFVPDYVRNNNTTQINVNITVAFKQLIFEPSVNSDTIGNYQLVETINNKYNTRIYPSTNYFSAEYYRKVTSGNPTLDSGMRIVKTPFYFEFNPYETFSSLIGNIQTTNIATLISTHPAIKSIIHSPLKCVGTWYNKIIIKEKVYPKLHMPVIYSSLDDLPSYGNITNNTMNVSAEITYEDLTYYLPQTLNEANTTDQYILSESITNLCNNTTHYSICNQSSLEVSGTYKAIVKDDFFQLSLSKIITIIPGAEVEEDELLYDVYADYMSNIMYSLINPIINLNITDIMSSDILNIEEHTDGAYFSSRVSTEQINPYEFLYLLVNDALTQSFYTDNLPYIFITDLYFTPISNKAISQEYIYIKYTVNGGIIPMTSKYILYESNTYFSNKFELLNYFENKDSNEHVVDSIQLIHESNSGFNKTITPTNYMSTKIPPGRFELKFIYSTNAVITPIYVSITGVYHQFNQGSLRRKYCSITITNNTSWNIRLLTVEDDMGTSYLNQQTDVHNKLTYTYETMLLALSEYATCSISYSCNGQTYYKTVTIT